MRAVAARLIAGWNQNIAAALHALDLTLQNSQLGRVHLIVRRIDGVERGLDLFQVRRRVVIARAVVLVNHVVGVGPAILRLAVKPALEGRVGLIARGILLQQLQGARGHHEESEFSGIIPLRRLSVYSPPLNSGSFVIESITILRSMRLRPAISTGAEASGIRASMKSGYI